MGDLPDDDVDEDCLLISVLKKGAVVEYNIPTFPAITVQLREVQLQCEGDDGSVVLIDGFMRECELTNQPLPALAEVPYDLSHAFFVDVSEPCVVFECNVSLCPLLSQGEEFELSVNISKYKLHCQQVFVIWKWTWKQEESECERDDDPIGVDTDTSSEESEVHSSEDELQITHSVVFKCIGCTKEGRYQHILSMASKKIKQGQAVSVKLQKEPDNVKDSRAIAFVCNANCQWERIGYVVREALDAVCHAMDNNLINEVRFDWIKYIVHFKNPGWYAGVAINKSGRWPTSVLRCQTKSYSS